MRSERETEINGMAASNQATCCRVEAVVNIDDRGQMVLPKEIRDKANIQAGDKLAVLTWGTDTNVCCVSLIRTDDLSDMVKNLLGPMMKAMSPP